MLICVDTAKLAAIARDIYDMKDEGMANGMEKVYRALGFDVYESEGLVELQPETTAVGSLDEMWR